MALTPLERKIRLLRNGVTFAQIARELDPPVTTATVSMVNAGKRVSPRVERAIAEAIGLSVDRAFGTAAQGAA